MPALRLKQRFGTYNYVKNGVCVFCLAFLPKKVELVYVNAIYFVFCAEAALYTVGYTIQKDGCFL